MKSIDYIYEKKGRIRFSSNVLKIVAMVTMLIDHIGFMLIGNGKLYGYDMSLYNYVSVMPTAKYWVILYRLCRIVGRISFPIYSFLIVEGFFRTNNLFKYIVRLTVLALLSEIPYDLMVSNTIFSINSQNVIWTYVISLIMLAAIDRLREYPVFQFIIVAFSAFIAWFVRTDYNYIGVVLIAFYYATCMDKNLRSLGSGIITFLSSLQNNYGAGALSTFFIHFYDGTKGSFDFGRLHYWFYPVHMLILYAIVYFSYLFK